MITSAGGAVRNLVPFSVVAADGYALLSVASEAPRLVCHRLHVLNAPGLLPDLATRVKRGLSPRLLYPVGIEYVPALAHGLHNDGGHQHTNHGAEPVG